MATSHGELGPCPWQPKVFLTGHNDEGQAIVQESYGAKEKIFSQHAFTNHHLYCTKGHPVDLNDHADIKGYKEWAASERVGITVKNGTVCRYVNLAPGHQPLAHRTQSIDFGIVMDGNVIMELDDGSSTALSKGDIVVQRGTWHAWRNPSQTEWARMAFVLQDAQPLKNVKEDMGGQGGVGDVFSSTHGNDSS